MIAIGIDVGGTSIKGAAITDEGKRFDTFSLPVIKGEKPEVTINKLINIVKQYIADNDLNGKIVGVGLGIPGVVDIKKGIVCSCSNLKWENIPLVELMEKELNIPVRITNDANAAALGESVFGVARGTKISVMITLGTGVGGGIIVDGKLFEGNEGKGAELGHMIINVDGYPCGCGRKGCFEQYASASALIRDTKIAMDNNPNSLMHNIASELGIIDGRVAFKAARSGDEAAQKVVDQYIKYLSEGLLNICNIFRPEVIVLSGGIANEGDYLFDRVNSYLKNQNYGYLGSATPAVKVIPAKLGYDSGKIGAAALFFE